MNDFFFFFHLRSKIQMTFSIWWCTWTWRAWDLNLSSSQKASNYSLILFRKRHCRDSNHPSPERSSVDFMSLSRPKVEVAYNRSRTIEPFLTTKIEAGGFEPLTLSMTRMSWDWRSRPLDHHGRCSLIFFCHLLHLCSKLHFSL